MPRFVFWNTGKRQINHLIKEVVRVEAVDLLILAELAGSPFETLASLNEKDADYQYSPGNCSKLHFFTRFDHRFLTPARESQRYSIRNLTLPARNELILAGVHLPSQMTSTPFDISIECGRLASEITAQEELRGHSRTILIGDLNLNPFDDGLVAAAGLHASMSRQVASREHRTIQGRQYRFFYNPMWSYLGDRFGTTSGTYYYEKAQQTNYFWNAFDQVLLRPALLGGFHHDQLRVITSAGPHSLIDNKGRPDGRFASDHLPIYIDLKF
jgi:endonuclease/exonuclease/phosphatase family metal-dependent hydrolase